MILNKINQLLAKGFHLIAFTEKLHKKILNCYEKNNKYFGLNDSLSLEAVLKGIILFLYFQYILFFFSTKEYVFKNMFYYIKVASNIYFIIFV